MNRMSIFFFLALATTARVIFCADGDSSGNNGAIIFKPVPTQEEHEQKHASTLVPGEAQATADNASPDISPRPTHARRDSPQSISSDDPPGQAFDIDFHAHPNAAQVTLAFAQAGHDINPDYESDPEDVILRIISLKPELSRHQSHFESVLREHNDHDHDRKGLDRKGLLRELDRHTRGTPITPTGTLVFSKSKKARPPITPTTPLSQKIMAREKPEEFNALVLQLIHRALSIESEAKEKIAQEKMVLEKQKLELEKQRLAEEQNARRHKKRCNLATVLAVLGTAGTIAGVVAQFTQNNGCNGTGGS